MALTQLLYLSSLVVNSKAVLLQILEVSIINNRRRHITGMLLCADGNILQVVEGETAALYATFASIEADTRHHGIIVLLEKKIQARCFSEWSLGFKQISQADIAAFPKIAPVFKMGDKPFPVRIQPCDAITAMQSFARELPNTTSKQNIHSALSN
jgi:hypothetical protein